MEAMDYGGHEFGGGRGPIWLDNVDCDGGESSILECGHSGIGEHNCGHSEDVSVRCRLSKFYNWVDTLSSNHNVNKHSKPPLNRFAIEYI